MTTRGNLNVDLVAKLCPRCGMCCNGALFVDVKLRRGDSAGKLKALGLGIRRQGSKCSFPQPCHAFDGTWCRIYENRPRHCRAFECHSLLEAKGGHLSVAEAIRIIRKTRRLHSEVVRLLKGLGDTEDHLPLTERYQRVFAQPWDFSRGPAEIRLRNRLFAATQDLAALLERHFLGTAKG